MGRRHSSAVPPRRVSVAVPQGVSTARRATLSGAGVQAAVSAQLAQLALRHGAQRAQGPGAIAEDEEASEEEEADAD